MFISSQSMILLGLTQYKMVTRTSKHISDFEINHDLHLYYQQAKAKACRLVIKHVPIKLLKVILSSREELEHAVNQSLWLENCWKYIHNSNIFGNKKNIL